MMNSPEQPPLPYRQRGAVTRKTQLLARNAAVVEEVNRLYNLKRTRWEDVLERVAKLFFIHPRLVRKIYQDSLNEKAPR